MTSFSMGCGRRPVRPDEWSLDPSVTPASAGKKARVGEAAGTLSIDSQLTKFSERYFGPSVTSVLCSTEPVISRDCRGKKMPFAPMKDEQIRLLNSYMECIKTIVENQEKLKSSLSEQSEKLKSMCFTTASALSECKSSAALDKALLKIRGQILGFFKTMPQDEYDALEEKLMTFEFLPQHFEPLLRLARSYRLQIQANGGFLEGVPCESFQPYVEYGIPCKSFKPHVEYIVKEEGIKAGVAFAQGFTESKLRAFSALWAFNTYPDHAYQRVECLNELMETYVEQHKEQDAFEFLDLMPDAQNGYTILFKVLISKHQFKIDFSLTAKTVEEREGRIFKVLEAMKSTLSSEQFRLSELFTMAVLFAEQISGKDKRLEAIKDLFFVYLSRQPSLISNTEKSRVSRLFTQLWHQARSNKDKAQADIESQKLINHYMKHLRDGMIMSIQDLLPAIRMIESDDIKDEILHQWMPSTKIYGYSKWAEVWAEIKNPELKRSLLQKTYDEAINESIPLMQSIGNELKSELNMAWIFTGLLDSLDKGRMMCWDFFLKDFTSIEDSSKKDQISGAFARFCIQSQQPENLRHAYTLTAYTPSLEQKKSNWIQIIKAYKKPEDLEMAYPLARGIPDKESQEEATELVMQAFASAIRSIVNDPSADLACFYNAKEKVEGTEILEEEQKKELLMEIDVCMRNKESQKESAELVMQAFVSDIRLIVNDPSADLTCFFNAKEKVESTEILEEEKKIALVAEIEACIRKKYSFCGLG